jgi:hypothetical protein
MGRGKLRHSSRADAVLDCVWDVVQEELLPYLLAERSNDCYSHAIFETPAE